MPLHRFSRFKPTVARQEGTFKRSFRHVNGLVHLQLSFVRENFMADLAFDLIVRMNVFVSFQQGFLFVSVAAYVAREASRLGVSRLVSSHQIYRLKGFAAK